MGIAQILAENQRLRAEAEQVAARAADLALREARLAEQLAGVDALRKEIADRDEAIAERDAKLAAVIATSEALSRQLDMIRLKGQGPRNERYLDDQTLPLFTPMNVPTPMPPVPGQEETDIEHKRDPKPRGVQRRRRLSERDDMPTREMVCARDRKVGCASCGGDLADIGTEVSYRVDFEPGRFVRLKVVREKCACPKCPSQGVLTAPEPSFALRHAMCGNRLLARVIVDKFADGLPLNRQCERMAREGFDVETTVVASWVLSSAALLKPVVEAVEASLLSRPCLLGDDTGFPVQDGSNGKLRNGRLWCYTDQRQVSFQFTDTKAGRFPADFLAAFKGDVLVCDCGSEFNQVVRELDIERAGCWAHLRRYFFDARHHHPAEARLALVAIRELFAIEDKIRGRPAEDIVMVRAEQSQTIVDRLFTWIRAQSVAVRPKTTFAAAVGYALNNEPVFRTFLARGDVSMDNNVSERMLRAPVVGRKAWLFARSEGGAIAAARLFTLTRSCALQAVDPMVYLIDVLDRLPDFPAHRVHELTPLNWRLARDGLPLELPSPG
jgi:transposase